MNPAPPSKPKGPQFRLLVILGGMLFAGFLLTSAISYWVSRNSIRAAILQTELPLSSDNIYSEIQRDLFEPILISSLMANDTFVKDWIKDGEKDEAAIINYLAHIQEKYRTLTAFLVSEGTRKYYNTTHVLKEVKEAEPADAWFFRVRQMPSDYEINVDPDMSNDNAMTIFINYRIVDKAGHFLAATGVGLSVNAVKTLMQEYRTRYHRDVYFYDRQGRLVLHSLAGAGDVQLTNHQAEEVMQSVLRRIAQGETQITASAVGRSGAMANYRYIPELEWILVVEQVSDGTRPIFFQSLGLNLLICLLTSVVLLKLIRTTVLRYQERLEAKNTELTRREDQLLKANAAREKLFSIIGHDLRGPIGNIKSSLDLLGDGTLDAKTFHEFRDDLGKGVNHVLVTLENLMEWGSLQSDSFRARVEDVDLRSAAQKGIELLSLVAKEKNIQVENAIPEDAVARADSYQIQAVLRNLLSNAVKFTPKNGEVRLSAAREGTGWRVSVRDNGVGMDAERVSRLLAREHETPSSPGTENERGLGLGLQLCQDFVRANHGVLAVESTEGRGTTVSFTLPAA